MCVGRDESVAKAYTTAKQLHRCFYMGERGTFFDRRLHGHTAKKSCMLLAIDIAESSSFGMPFGGSQITHSTTMKNNICGCLIGNENHLRIYRTCHTVNKGADLIIEIILSELDNWLLDEYHIGPPDVIYLNVDGGSENAKKFVWHIWKY